MTNLESRVAKLEKYVGELGDAIAAQERTLKEISSRLKAIKDITSSAAKISSSQQLSIEALNTLAEKGAQATTDVFELVESQRHAMQNVLQVLQKLSPS